MSRFSGRVLATLSVILATTLPALAFQTSGQSMIIVDYLSGAVLAEQNADERLPPASMSKLMTLYMAFEALEQGRLTLDTKLPVSEHAASYKGSSMFLVRGERITVEDLLRGVIVLSGNDASAVLAEALSPDGTEEGFAELMNRRGVEIGLTNSNFTNANGWPHPDHWMSVRDLAVLTAAIIRNFPDYYLYFAEEEFRFDERVPENRYNRNPLLKLDLGADGLKTGYTQAAGYGLVGSAVKGNRRVIFVISGLKSRTRRTEEGEQIVNWYFIQFTEKTLYQAGDTVVHTPVWMGEEATVAAAVPENAYVLIPSSMDTKIEANAVFDSHVEAPVVEGQELGHFVVSVSGLNYTATFPLVAANSVDRAGYLGTWIVAARSLFGRLIAEVLPGDT